MKSTICVAVVAALSVGFPLLLAPSAPAKDGDGKLQISVDDLGKTAELVGRLGKPLGTWVTVQGTWSYPKSQNSRRPKDASLRFTVSHVNSVKLAEPVEFNIAQVDAKNRQGQSAIPEFKDRQKFDGRSWTLKAYESGRLKIDTPPEYYQAIGVKSGLMQEPYWSIDGFVSEIHGVLPPE